MFYPSTSSLSMKNNRRMKKIILLFLLALSLCANAQLTSLTIDNQTPGWLSSKINYGDQKTIKNLKVTGYINSEDLMFIGEMISRHSLRGCIDLEDVNIVGSTASEDNVMPENSFNIQWSADNPDGIHVSQIVFPLSLSKSKKCLSSELYVDKITIGGKAMPIVKGEYLYSNTYSGGDGIRFNKRVRQLVIREGVTEIPKRAFYNEPSNGYGTKKDECRFESVEFPSTITKIEESAFKCCYALEKLTLPSNIETIEGGAFWNTSFTPDTLDIPVGLKVFYTSSFPKKQGQVIKLKENLELFDNDIWILKKTDNINFIIHRIKPPTFRKGSSSSSYSDGKELSGCTIYVPKEGYSFYKDPNYNSVNSTWSGWTNPWSHATINTITVGVKSIKLESDSLYLVIGETGNISASINPENADNKTLIWSTSNDKIVKVDNNGTITAVDNGQATITASSIDNPQVQAACLVFVHQPVTNVNLYKHELDLKVGQSETLRVDVLPTNADDKSLTWKSENDTIAIVDERGKITGLKSGKVKIYAISNDNDKIMDYCDVSVTQPVSGLKLNYSKYEIKGIGNTVKLEATVMPEDATNQEVRWVSSNDAVCMVSAGNVVSTGLGTAVIIATTVDGGYMATCTINVVEEKQYATGDVNGDGTVDITDVNIIINILLGKDNAEKYDGRAHVTGNSIVDISDANAIINIILGR